MARAEGIKVGLLRPTVAEQIRADEPNATIT
jgi:hypothetical protein